MTENMITMRNDAFYEPSWQTGSLIVINHQLFYLEKTTNQPNITDLIIINKMLLVVLIIPIFDLEGGRVKEHSSQRKGAKFLR